ncbi:hypothetical protein BC332_30628 [Capsicum chinense]|nr:hypothetical protein BC332_30628 [Capsicum chinense]
MEPTFCDNWQGDISEELAAAAAPEDDVNFYQTASPDVAKLFHIDSQAKRPALVIIKKEVENINHFEIFENPIKKQLILIATSKDSDKFLPIFQGAVKAFKGKEKKRFSRGEGFVSPVLTYDSPLEHAYKKEKPVFSTASLFMKHSLSLCLLKSTTKMLENQCQEYFGVRGDAPKVLAYTGNEDGRKFLLEGEITLDGVKSFGEKFLEDNLKPFYKSDQIPETNDGDVKIVVGNNFDEIVLGESKDVLLESEGFPTLLIFPAGNKSFDPITVDTDRKVVAFNKFLKKYASTPFKILKPASMQKTRESDKGIPSIGLKALYRVEVERDNNISIEMTPSNPGCRFFGCKVSKENGGCGYFRWIDPKPSISVHQYPEVESSLMIKCKDDENPCDRLKQKLKDVEQERDTLCEKLKDSEEKLIALRQKLKKV